MVNRKLVFSVMTIALFTSTGFAQTGAITSEMLTRFEKTIAADATIPAAQNAVTNNDIKKVALNRSLIGTLDHHFAHTIKTSGITDQKSSGRCWLFSSLNVIRPKVIKKYDMKSFGFSQNYLFFYDQLEKANLFLTAIVQTREKPIDDRTVDWLFRNPIGDGGVWSMTPSLIEKYGVVPAENMPDTYNSENTRRMNELISRKLRDGGLKLRAQHQEGKPVASLEKSKENMLGEIYHILVISLGTPPKEFVWRFADKKDSLIVKGKFTPVRFYNEVVQANLGDYVMLMDDPSRDYYKLYEIEFDRNRYDSQNWTFVNVPSSDMKSWAKTSILADEPMYFSCDVGKQLDSERGILATNAFDYQSLFGVSFDMSKKDQVLSYESASSHGMALVGVDTSATGAPTKWLLENSWGEEAAYKGNLTMTDDWFDQYMYRIVILKRFLPEKVLVVLAQKPVKLPPWDRMY
ncbi:MAG: C1 family peptidase, partial [Candidatus Neomarinimicrobiota bacterium]